GPRVGGGGGGPWGGGAGGRGRNPARLRQGMLAAASALDFELAIRLRDEVRRLEALQLEMA
ncbi:MAG: UvrB/UvrC motif-containing protein, partial [Planctomycetes bacterium]|nr:UvrB/UvrC motif-containing protein [Planctomycetota bacterium]